MSKDTIYNYVRQSPTNIVDEQYTDVGTTFTLGTHKRAFLGSSFVLTRTQGGAPLTAGVDYELAEKDAFYSQSSYENEDVFTRVNILNATYETGDLFATYDAVLTYATTQAVRSIPAKSVVADPGDDATYETSDGGVHRFTGVVGPYEKIRVTSVTSSANRNTLRLPGGTTMDVNATASWVTGKESLATPASRAGKDIYIVPTAGGLRCTDVSSADAVMGFHGLCATVGTATYAYVNEGRDGDYLAEVYITPPAANGDTRHWLRDYQAGDVLPFSCWTLSHRPARAETEGKAYLPGLDRWVDIYLASWDAGARKLRSVFGAAFVTGATTVKFHPARFDQVFGLQGQQMPSKQEFVAYSIGGPQGVNIAGSANPGTTGGHSATNSLRITSNIGCEDTAGVLWQWGRDHSSNSRSSWANGFDANDSNVAGQDYSDPTRPLFGGAWGDGASCGSRGALWHSASLALLSAGGSRGVAEPAR